MSSSFMLRPYQIQDARRMAGMTRALNASQMRTGKTPTACGAAKLVLEETDVARFITISPKSLRENWCREWSRFGLGSSGMDGHLHTHYVHQAVHPHGLPKELCRPTGRIGKEGKALISSLGNYGVIVDEAHLYLGHGMMSKRIRNLIAGARYAWLLSGSWIRTNIMDAYTLAWMLGVDKTMYGGLPNFCYMTGGGKGSFDRWEVGPNIDKVLEPWAKYQIRRTRAEVAPHLSEVEYAFQVVDGPMIVETKRAVPILRAGKLPRFVDYTEALLQQATRRIPEALRWAEERELADSRALVFCSFREPLRAFDGRPGWAVVDGEGARDWRGQKLSRDGLVEHHREYTGIASTIGALGVGHTLDGIDEVLFIDQKFVPADNRQAADRIVGSNKRSLVTIFTSDDRLDLSLQETLAGRSDLLDAALSIKS